MLNSYDKFTENFKKVIQKGAWICLNELKKTLTPTHLFLGILSVTESLACEILKKNGISSLPLHEQQLYEPNALVTGIKPEVNYNQVFSLSMDTEAVKILEIAADIAITYNHSSVGTEHLLAAMVELKSAPLAEALQKTNVDVSKLKKNIEEVLKNNLSQLDAYYALPSQTKPSTHKIDQKTHRKVTEKKPAPLRRQAIQPTPALDYFTTDLTSLEKKKEYYPLVGREKEVARLINILSRKHKNNPLLLGEPGVGKTAIVEGLAQKIIEGDVPDILAAKRILSLDLNALVAGTIYRGEFENRLKQIVEEVKSQDDVVLFIDEIHNLVGTGSASGSLDAANILKPYLARGELACIGATTFAEFKNHFESDATLERRYQPIIVEEPSAAATLEILKGIRTKLEEYHHITITDEALEAAVDLSGRFIPHKYFPDKAIDLLDEAASRVRVENSKNCYGKKMRETKRKLKELIAEKEHAVQQENFQQAMSFKEKEETFLYSLHRLKQKQEKEQTRKIGTIDKPNIVRIITEIVKIPFLEMANIDARKLLHLEDLLAKHVRGQREALKSIAKTLRRSQVGLADPKRPLASFVFLGPSGVGKTETARAIAEEIFGDDHALIRVNMSEFQENFNISKLIGAPAGYVGYKDGNQLADKVRSKPYAVVLFDEMEKAHPDVFNLLLQVLEDGYLIDAGGKHINFKNTVIIFTSNIGIERFNQTQHLGFAAHGEKHKERLKIQFEKLKNHILEELYATYRVEFLNRIDKILVFEPLTPNVVSQIVELNIQELNAKLVEKALRVELTELSKKLLAKLSFSPDDGARSVRRIVQEQIEERLVEKLLKGAIKPGDTIKIKAQGNKILLQNT